MRTRSILFGVAMALFISGTAFSQDVIEGCYPITMEDAVKFNPPSFESYSVTEHFTGKPAPVKLDRDSWDVRTQYKTQAAKGPNFAGHYTIIKWGCGSACMIWSIVDASTGRIYDSSINVGSPYGDAEAIQYRKDSRLIVLVGETEEGNESTTGIHYYLWKNNHLELLKFIRDKKHVCGPKKQRKHHENTH